MAQMVFPAENYQSTDFRFMYIELQSEFLYFYRRRQARYRNVEQPSNRRTEENLIVTCLQKDEDIFKTYFNHLRHLII